MEQIDISNLGKSAEMLAEEKFWGIVEKSLEHTWGEEEQEEKLIEEIAKLPPKEMIGFRLRTDQLLYDTYNSAMWCAGYLMNQGCSDDGFEYFRNWLISRGKETYYQAKENPDHLIQEVSADQSLYDFENFWYVALEAFKRKTGMELYDYIDEDQFMTKESNYPEMKFNWEEDDPESMQALCPKLFEVFWE